MFCIVDDNELRQKQWHARYPDAKVLSTLSDLRALILPGRDVLFVHASNHDVSVHQRSDEDSAARTAALIDIACRILGAGGRFVLFSGGDPGIGVRLPSIRDGLLRFTSGFHYQIVANVAPDSFRGAVPEPLPEQWRIDSLLETPPLVAGREFLAALSILCQGYLVVHSLRHPPGEACAGLGSASALASWATDQLALEERWERVQNWRWWQEGLGAAAGDGWALAVECGGQPVDAAIKELHEELANGREVSPGAVATCLKGLSHVLNG